MTATDPRRSDAPGGTPDKARALRRVAMMARRRKEAERKAAAARDHLTEVTQAARDAGATLAEIAEATGVTEAEASRRASGRSGRTPPEAKLTPVSRGVYRTADGYTVRRNVTRDWERSWELVDPAGHVIAGEYSSRRVALEALANG
jgi:hypothetical protein